MGSDMALVDVIGPFGRVWWTVFCTDYLFVLAVVIVSGGVKVSMALGGNDGGGGGDGGGGDVDW